jgi:hypothetical protein
MAVPVANSGRRVATEVRVAIGQSTRLITGGHADFWQGVAESRGRVEMRCSFTYDPVNVGDYAVSIRRLEAPSPTSSSRERGEVNRYRVELSADKYGSSMHTDQGGLLENLFIQ